MGVPVWLEETDELVSESNEFSRGTSVEFRKESVDDGAGDGWDSIESATLGLSNENPTAVQVAVDDRRGSVAGCGIGSVAHGKSLGVCLFGGYVF